MLKCDSLGQVQLMRQLCNLDVLYLSVRQRQRAREMAVQLPVKLLRAKRGHGRLHSTGAVGLSY